MSSVLPLLFAFFRELPRRVTTGDGILHADIAGLLEFLQRLAAHLCIDLRIGRTNNRCHFLQAKEDDSIMYETDPVPVVDQPAFLGRQPEFLVQLGGIVQKAITVCRFHQPVQEIVQPVGPMARFQCERVRAL
jgi:hypothetical protein